MDSPGLFTLAALQINVALSAQVQTPIDGLDGMEAATIEAAFGYGSGGTSCTAVVQTTLDGTNWRDVARFEFATTAAVKYCNLSGLTPKGILSLAPLGSEGVVDGFLGDAMRCVITSTGTYVGTTLAVRLSAR